MDEFIRAEVKDLDEGNIAIRIRVPRVLIAVEGKSDTEMSLFRAINELLSYWEPSQLVMQDGLYIIRDPNADDFLIHIIVNRRG